MAIMNFKDYAYTRGISYQAVRKLYVRYEEELKEHVSEQNGTRYLTEEAQKILDEKRRKSPVVVVEARALAEVEDLKKELEEVKKERDQVKDDLIKALKEQKELIALQTKYDLLLEDKEARAKELEELKNKVKEAETEVSKYKRSIFGFYRKEKA